MGFATLYPSYAPPAPLLHRFAVVAAVVEQLQIGLDVGIARVLGLRLFEHFVRAGVVAAQHVGEAFVVEELDGRADQADRLGIGAVGERS
jgi:hypothetical protein